MVLSKEQRQKIEKVISQVSEEEGIDWWEARTLIHKCICSGKCGWYKTWGEKAGFDRSSVTAKQKRRIEETISEIMRELTIRRLGHRSTSSSVQATRQRLSDSQILRALSSWLEVISQQN